MRLWMPLLFLLVAAPWSLNAGGTGLNVAVVINTNSPDSIALGNYFCEQRQVPPENVLRMSWSGGNMHWSLAQFQAHLLQPLQAMIEGRGLSSQIHFVALSMDIPFSVTNEYAVNSTTAVLFYGFNTLP